MTVFPKPSAIIKKAIIGNNLSIAEKGVCDEEKVEIHGEDGKSSTHGVFYISIMAVTLAVFGFTIGLMLCRQMFGGNSRRHYQGYCSILIPKDMREMDNDDLKPNFRVLPLEWLSQDVQIVSPEEELRDKFVKAVREHLDIGGMVERIVVVNDGHKVNFIHDFNENTSGIIDSDRCWMMDLDPEFVLSPDMFIDGLENGGLFDVSRVKDNLRAALPALNEIDSTASEFGEKCATKPVYRLTKNYDILQKRSIYDLQPDYLQFAGKHVQEILIDNLADVLEHEKQMRDEK